MLFLSEHITDKNGGQYKMVTTPARGFNFRVLLYILQSDPRWPSGPQIFGPEVDYETPWLNFVRAIYNFGSSENILIFPMNGYLYFVNQVELNAADSATLVRVKFRQLAVLI